jgi:hypothetical protein
MTSVTLENLSEEKNSYDKKLGNARRLSLWFPLEEISGVLGSSCLDIRHFAPCWDLLFCFVESFGGKERLGLETNFDFLLLLWLSSWLCTLNIGARCKSSVKADLSGNPISAYCTCLEKKEKKKS